MDKTLAKYFLNQWRLVVQRIGDNLWATNGYLMVRTSEESQIFADRKIFPELPEDGKTLIYYGTGKRVEKLRNGLKDSPEKKDLDLMGLMPKYSPETDQIEITDLYVACKEGDLRIAVAGERIVTLVAEQVAIFEDASYYQARADSAIAIEIDGELVGVTMPGNPENKDVEKALATIRRVILKG